MYVNDKNARTKNRWNSGQKGIAVLAMMALLLTVITSLVISMVSINKSRLKKQASDIDVLNTAQEALLGYALRQPSIGQLPCPDYDGDGYENKVGVNCQASLGYFPYKTLQLDVLRDGSGTKLWYAVEPSYTLIGVDPLAGSALRYNVTEEVAVVLFSPGAALTSQTRGINDNARRYGLYLEGDNANANFNQFSKNKSDTNNDEIFVIDVDRYRLVVCRLHPSC